MDQPIDVTDMSREEWEELLTSVEDLEPGELIEIKYEGVIYMIGYRAEEIH